MDDLMLLLRLYPSLLNKIYAILRWIICPFNKMESHLPDKGEILDIGCGEGIFSIYVALKSKKRKVIGIDLDQNKISIAQKAGRGVVNLQFKAIDGLHWHKKVDSIVISDVFHHFTCTNQELFLVKVKTLLEKGGRLIIKEVNKDDLIRAKLTRLWDLILYPHDQIKYWSTPVLTKKLEGLGFKVLTKREAIYFPGSTILYICSKK